MTKYNDFDLDVQKIEIELNSGAKSPESIFCPGSRYDTLCILTAREHECY